MISKKDHPTIEDDVSVRVVRITKDGGRRIEEQEFCDVRPSNYATFKDEWQTLTEYEKDNILDMLVAELTPHAYENLKSKLVRAQMRQMIPKPGGRSTATPAKMLTDFGLCECCHCQPYQLHHVVLPRGPASLCTECNDHVSTYLTEFA